MRLFSGVNSEIYCAAEMNSEMFGDGDVRRGARVQRIGRKFRHDYLFDRQRVPVADVLQEVSEVNPRLIGHGSTLIPGCGGVNSAMFRDFQDHTAFAPGGDRRRNICRAMFRRRASSGRRRVLRTRHGLARATSLTRVSKAL